MMSRVKVLKAGTTKSDPLKYLCELLLSLLDILAGVYMIIMMVVLPLYTTETGYTSIGTEKCMFFRSVSVASCRVIIPISAVYLLCRLAQWLRTKKGSGAGIKIHILSGTDLFALLYLAAVVGSYLHTAFQEPTERGDAFYGVYGWYLGLLTQLLFVGIYFMISRFWRRRAWMVLLWAVPMVIVCLLGYLNRFGIYPLAMEATGPQYISTIGNINWYCGYLVTVLSMFAYYLWQGRELCEKRWIYIGLCLLLGVGLSTLVTQGSSSGVVTLLVLLGVFYLFSMRNVEKLRRFWTGCILLAAVCILTYVIRLIWPEAITYTESTTDILTLSPLPFLLLAVSLLCRYLVCRNSGNGRFQPRGWIILGVCVWAAAGVAVLVYIVLLVVNTLYPGCIGGLSELDSFTFNFSWGSNRGITWTAGMSCFLSQDIMGKLVGVGPDAMGLYIHSGIAPELKRLVEDYFGRLILTNAHNEWLTVLINEGILGAVGYIGLMVTAVWRYLRAGGKDALAGAAGMGILAYTVNNIFSFQQVMSTSAVFIILGIGEACVRNRK
ncbi:MAG: O-antigen ligase family protein [bacterium]|nr:O-antigen ligase family protein [bacterium]MCM1374415.1 O-antigen ligase family protein [Muribaculum sp.]